MAKENAWDQWRAGRVLLIGDAKHAYSSINGQGGAIAMEDPLFSEMSSCRQTHWTNLVLSAWTARNRVCNGSESERIWPFVPERTHIAA